MEDRKNLVSKRSEIQALASNVISNTEILIEMIPAFNKSFNEVLEFFIVEEFIYSNLEMQFVIIRETLEIYEVL